MSVKQFLRMFSCFAACAVMAAGVTGCGDNKEKDAAGGKISPPQGAAGKDTGNFGKIDLTNPADKK
jgi:hypothetical protein